MKARTLSMNVIGKTIEFEIFKTIGNHDEEIIMKNRNAL